MASGSAIPLGKVLAVLWLALWLGALALPVAITGSNPGDQLSGWMVLIIGWLGVMVLQVGWFANLAFLASLPVLASSRKFGWLSKALTLVLILTTIDALFWREMYYDNGSEPIRTFGSGYYLWFAAMVGASVSLVWRMSGRNLGLAGKAYSPNA